MKGHNFTGEGGQCELHSLIHTHLFEKTERVILEKWGKETPLQNIFKNNLHREKFENVLKTGKPTTMVTGKQNQKESQILSTSDRAEVLGFWATRRGTDAWFKSDSRRKESLWLHPSCLEITGQGS